MLDRCSFLRRASLEGTWLATWLFLAGCTCGGASTAPSSTVSPDAGDEGGAGGAPSGTGGAPVGAGGAVASTGGAGGGASTGGAGAVPLLPDGAACTQDVECAHGFCLREELAGWPGGYCTVACNQLQGCAEGSVCASVSSSAAFCAAACAADAGIACRAAYACTGLSGGAGACLPACTADGDCPTVGHCDLSNGVCIVVEDCENHVDDDQNGLTDCEDPACASACEGAISAGCAAIVPTDAAISGDTSTGTSLAAGACTGANSPEMAYAFTPPSDGLLRLTLQSATDQGLYVRRICEDAATEIACVDAVGAGVDETLDVPVTAGVPIAVFVDGYQPGEAGPFMLVLDFQPATCGDGVVVVPEECDDGNTTPGDDCDASCRFEPQPEIEPNEGPSHATTAAPGLVAAAIDAPGDVDWFAVTIPGASTLTVRTTASGNDTCGPSGGIDTEIAVYGPDGATALATNDDIDALTSYCSRAELVALPAGTYFVRVAASSQFCDQCSFAYAVEISVQ